MASISILEFEKALTALNEALEFAKNSDTKTFKIARDACIQRFEFCIELAWKVSAKVLGSTSTSAKPLIREMAQNNLISSTEKWFDFIEARNKSSHSYDEDIASAVFKTVQSFLPEGQDLYKKLKTK